jgi:hypothetical protein
LFTFGAALWSAARIAALDFSFDDCVQESKKNPKRQESPLWIILSMTACKNQKKIQSGNSCRTPKHGMPAH